MEQPTPIFHPIQITDPGGDVMKVYKAHNGQILNGYFVDVDFDDIASYPLRDDDVFICSYPRSGVHWLWEQTRMVLEGKTDLDCQDDKEMSMLEFLFRGEMDAVPTPRVLNSHFKFDLLPKDLLKKKTKTILLYRNPKDVAVSYFNFHYDMKIYEYQGQFGNFLHLFQHENLDWGGYASFLKDWERVMTQHPDLPVHLVRYESLQEHPVQELSRLGEFLGKRHNPKFLQEVVNSCTINKLRARRTAYWDRIESYIRDALYKKGEAGRWKDWFTVAQNEHFDNYWTKAMEGSKLYSFKYSIH